MKLFRSVFFFFNDTATTEIYTLSLHDALPIFFVRVSTSALKYPMLRSIFCMSLIVILVCTESYSTWRSLDLSKRASSFVVDGFLDVGKRKNESSWLLGC